MRRTILSMFAAVVGIFSVSVMSVSAVRDTDLEMQVLTSCGKQGFTKVGVWTGTSSDKRVQTGCAADFAASTGMVPGTACNSGNAICCVDTKDGNKPKCLPFTDIKVVEVAPEVKTGVCISDVGACTSGVTEAKCKELKGTFNETMTCPKMFEPNVPIPNLFEGSKPINDSLLATYIGAFYVYFIGVTGILAIVMIMWGGYHYITSFGNPQRMNQGKEIISSSIIGLILALTSYLLLTTINPSLISLRGIAPTYIARVIQKFETTQRPVKQLNTSVDMSKGGLERILQRVKTGKYDEMVMANAGGDKELAYRGLAVLFIESAGKPKAASSANAFGLMQMIPSTAAQYGVANPRDLFTPETSIRAGMAFLKDLQSNPCPAYTKTSSELGIHCIAGDVCRDNQTEVKYMYAAYNGGRGANFCSKTCPGQTFYQCEKNKGYSETRTYVERAKKVYEWLVEKKVFG